MGLLYAIQTDFTITFRYIFYFCQDSFCVLRKRLRWIHRQPIRYINEAATAWGESLKMMLTMVFFKLLVRSFSIRKISGQKVRDRFDSPIPWYCDRIYTNFTKVID